MRSLEDLQFVGGHVALDFVNTAEERGHPEADDVLRTPGDLSRWGQRYGVLSGGSRSEADGAAQAELSRALEARELLYNLFLARVRGARPSEPDLADLSRLAAAAYRAGRLTRTAGGRVTWSWPRDELSTVRHVAITAAVDLLAGDQAQRLKQCPGEQCGWLFLDMTKRGNRRWCSMSECGQDAKTARRRARRLGGDAQSET
jgi:predicted RNA-binding Zn ribbon-like protein